MPGLDIDAPAYPTSGEAEIRTPWESIDPDEPALSAPIPNRARKSNTPRRRAKAAVAEFVYQSIPSISIADRAPETSRTPDDPDEAFAVMAFLPDEHLTLMELSAAEDEIGEQSTEEAFVDSAEPLVPIFLDRPEAELEMSAEADSSLTTSVGILSEPPAVVTESVDDVLAEKAFLADEYIEPLKTTELAAESNDDAVSIDQNSIATAGPMLMSQESPPVHVPEPAPVAYSQFEFNPGELIQIDSAPALEAIELISSDNSLAQPGDAPEISHVEQSITASIHSTEIVAGATNPAEVDASDNAFGMTNDAIEPTVRAVSETEESITAITTSDSLPNTADEIALTADETRITRPLARPIRYLRPVAGSLIAPKPKAAPVEDADDAELDPEPELAAADVITGGAWAHPLRYLKPVAGSLIAAQAKSAPAAEADNTELDPEPEMAAAYVTTGGGWTIPLMCVGISLIACCVIIPQSDLNRRLFYERQALQADLDSIQKQVAVNDEFLKEVIDNPTLAERLASRQMKTIRKGQKVLAVKQVSDDGEMSPFALVAVPRPPTPTPYRPVIGTIANLCNNARSRLYLLGVSMTMVAVGLVLGFNPKKSIEA